MLVRTTWNYKHWSCQNNLGLDWKGKVLKLMRVGLWQCQVASADSVDVSRARAFIMYEMNLCTLQQKKCKLYKLCFSWRKVCQLVEIFVLNRDIPLNCNDIVNHFIAICQGDHSITKSLLCLVYHVNLNWNLEIPFPKNVYEHSGNIIGITDSWWWSGHPDKLQ